MTELSDAEKLQIKDMIAKTGTAPEQPKPAEAAKPKQKPAETVEDDNDTDASTDTNDDDDMINDIKKRETELKKLDKQVDEKIKKLSRIVARAEMSGKTHAGYEATKSPEQIQTERIKKRFAGTGIETYIG